MKYQILRKTFLEKFFNAFYKGAQSTKNKVFQNVPSKIYGRQPLKDLKWYKVI